MRLTKIRGTARIVRKKAASGSQLCTHIADGGTSRSRKGGHTLAEVLQDGIGAALGGQDTQQIQYDILGRGPSAEFAMQMHAYHAGHLQFPGLSRQHIHSVGSAYTYGHHAQSARIGRMAVGAYYHTAREGIVFQYHLVDNTGTGLPETDVILTRHRLQEVIHFTVFLHRLGQVGRCTYISPYQMVTVYRGRHCHPALSGIHKLEQCHLCRGILHGHTVGTESHIVLSTPVRLEL